MKSFVAKHNKHHFWIFAFYHLELLLMAYSLQNINVIRFSQDPLFTDLKEFLSHQILRKSKLQSQFPNIPQNEFIALCNETSIILERLSRDI